MYNIYDYSWMMEDGVRSTAYLNALRRYVKPGSVVVDLGAGVGTWALIAARLGARKAYAIECGPAIHIARLLADRNGLSEQVELFHAMSTAVELPEKADVIVFEIHGQQPLFASSLASIIDARKRFLKPGGILIPAQETLWATVVEAPETHEDCVGFWERPFHGIDMTPGKAFAADWMYKRRFKPEQAITEYVRYAVLDYASIETSDLVANLSLHCQRDAIGHGLHLWFDSEVSPGNSFSNAPGNPRTIFEGSFVPWPEPVPLRKGDAIDIAINFRLVDDYVWSIRTRISPANGSPVRYDQSFLRHNLPSLPKMSAGR